MSWGEVAVSSDFVVSHPQGPGAPEQQVQRLGSSFQPTVTYSFITLYLHCGFSLLQRGSRPWQLWRELCRAKNSPS